MCMLSVFHHLALSDTLNLTQISSTNTWKMLKYFVVFVFFIKYSVSDDLSSIVWNVKEKEFTNFDNLLKQQQSTPIVLFSFKNFNLAQFGKHASVYSSTTNDGGSLKHLKEVVDSSKGYLVTSEEIPLKILHSDLALVYNQSIDNHLLQKTSVLVVNVDSWKNLDELVYSVSGRFVNGNYVGILTNQQEQKKIREKREVDEKENPTKIQGNFTFIPVGHCKLYAERVYLVVRKNSLTNPTEKPVVCKFPLYRNPKVGKTICENYEGSIEFSYDSKEENPIEFKKCEISVKSLFISMIFDRSKATGWWYVKTVTMTVVAENKKLNVENDVVFTNENKTVEEDSYVQGFNLFSYACAEPPVVFTKPLQYEDKEEVHWSLKYGLGFKNLQVQPFVVKHNRTSRGTQFTQDVDDCMPFISIPIWMFIIPASMLISIVLCGMGMMASLKGNDRFESGKAKTLIINVAANK